MSSPVDPVLLEDILFQCIFAMGCGAQMDVDREAVKAFLTKVRPGFSKALFGPSPIGAAPGLPRWTPVRAFILNCCEAVGRLAAQKAAADGKYSIDTTHLMDAYSKVRTGNAGGPGDFCPP